MFGVINVAVFFLSEEEIYTAGTLKDKVRSFRSHCVLEESALCLDLCLDRIVKLLLCIHRDTGVLAFCRRTY